MSSICGFIMNWFQTNHGYIMALCTGAYTVFTSILVIQIGRSNELSRELERSRLRPIVSLHVELKNTISAW